MAKRAKEAPKDDWNGAQLTNELPPLQAEPVREKAPRNVPTAEAPARAATAQELLGALKTSGTPDTKIKPSLAWLEENPDATAEQLFRHMEAAEVAEGTLRKAGKWLWGPTWELEAAVLLHPADEINRLREQNARLEKQIAAANAERGGLGHRLAYLESENKRLLGEAAHLRSLNPTAEMLEPITV